MSRAESEGLWFDSPSYGNQNFFLHRTRHGEKNIFHYFLTELKTHLF